MDNRIDPATGGRVGFASSPEGPKDANGFDRINAHASGRFLRASSCPPAVAGPCAAGGFLPTGAIAGGRISSPAVAITLIALGAVAMVGGILLIASFGERLRVGRLLAGTPQVALADLPALASSRPVPYVAVEGRIDSDEAFEDHAHRPLVFRRTRTEVRGRFGWRTVDEARESVPFRVADARGEAAIDPADLRDGLVVIPREASGVAGDIPDRVPPGTPADTPVRIRIDQVSAVEHAIVLGVPTGGPAGVTLRPGAKRPLVLTTLERPEAMRILAGGRQALIRIAVALLAVGAVAGLAGLVAAIARLG